jgi:hypothetical protein
LPSVTIRYTKKCMSRLRTVFKILSLFSVATIAYAQDSRELSEARRKDLANTAFYCPIGRQPMHDSSAAWQIKPSAACKFNGPIDTKIHPLKLEAPVLNPLLSLSELKMNLQMLGVSMGSGNEFHLPTGQSFSVSQIPAKQMQDPLFHFNVFPKNWGNTFLSIQAREVGDIPAFIALATQALPTNSLFWKNPHFEEEAKVLPHLLGRKTYSALPLLSKCGNGQEWKSFEGRRALLVVGDLHNPPEADFFRSVIGAKKFSWVGLEIKQDLRPVLDSFLAATSGTEEDIALARITALFPANVIEPTKVNLRLLKAQKAKIILLDSDEAYTNFPFTNVAFHGLVISTRNSIWAAQIPSDWDGTAVMLGGLDHFIDTPGSDFQDFVLDRFSDASMGLINPHEKCF